MFQKVRELAKSLAIYGLGDVAVSAVNLLLLPVYVRYLSPSDYGVLALLASVEIVAKILFRLGLDGSFMRFAYEYRDAESRQRMASSIFFFLLAANGMLLVLSLVGAPILAEWLFGGRSHVRALQLTLVNTFAIGFTFFPFHVLRIEKRATQFSALTLARSVGTLLLRIVLVVGLDWGVLGVVLADTMVTAALVLLLLRWFRSLIRPVFSTDMLRSALRFGLPRVPHAAAQQIIAVGDKFVLSLFRPLSEIGVYSIGVSFGLTQKLFLSAFEYAWAPFYYENSGHADARRLFSVMTTYGLAVLAVMTAGLSAIGRDLLALATQAQAAQYVAAADVVTWTAVGVLFQGAYLLTSIGLNITKNTQYYPASTLVAAAANIGLNFALIPRFGFIGAAWANAASYAIQALLAFWFSQRVYPVPYETRRIGIIAAAAIAAALAGRALPAMDPLTGVLLRGLTVLIVYSGGLAMAGFFRPEELRALRGLMRGRMAAKAAPPPEVTEMGGEIVAADVAAEPVETGRGSVDLAGSSRPRQRIW